MATLTKFYQFITDLGKGVHNLNSNTLKVVFSNTAPTASTGATISDITQISAGNGYTTGGAALSGVGYTGSGGTGTLAATDYVFTASGGPVGPLRYVVIYNDTPTSPADPLIGYYDYTSSITLADGETLTLDFTTSVLTIA